MFDMPPCGTTSGNEDGQPTHCMLDRLIHCYAARLTFVIVAGIFFLSVYSIRRLAGLPARFVSNIRIS